MPSAGPAPPLLPLGLRDRCRATSPDPFLLLEALVPGAADGLG